MLLIEKPFEVWQNQDGSARFYFSHSDKNFKIGVGVLQPGSALPKHNRPKGFENLVQIEGKCQITIFENEQKIDRIVELNPGDLLRIAKGQWHIHANPFDKVSVTSFKLGGDITEIMDQLRQTHQPYDLSEK